MARGLPNRFRWRFIGLSVAIHVAPFVTLPEIEIPEEPPPKPEPFKVALVELPTGTSVSVSSPERTAIEHDSAPPTPRRPSRAAKTPRDDSADAPPVRNLETVERAEQAVRPTPAAEVVLTARAVQTEQTVRAVQSEQAEQTPRAEREAAAEVRLKPSPTGAHPLVVKAAPPTLTSAAEPPRPVADAVPPNTHAERPAAEERVTPEPQLAHPVVQTVVTVERIDRFAENRPPSRPREPLEPSRELLIAMLKRRVEEVVPLVYSDEVHRGRIMGVPTVRFRLSPKGYVIGFKLVRSSGLPVIDRAARKALHLAEPFIYVNDWIEITLIFRG